MKERPPRTVRTFNPGLFQSDEEVVAQFAVRQVELETVLRVVRDNLGSPSCQHVLVVGPRGRGKTMLLARLAAELRAGAELRQRPLPVRFMEESHEVFTLADFWLETLFHLARELAALEPELSGELREAHADLKSRWRERELADRARAAVMGAAELLDRHLVLMVENLQALCEAVDDGFGWGLRQALQTEPRLTLVATATSRFDGLDDVTHAFFELFRTVCLKPLDTESCHRLWSAVGGGERTEREIEPIRILTGGSPRLLVMIARFARHLSLRRLMDELVALIDDHTEYFRSHLEALPKTERRVYLALIDLWRPSTTGEIAKRASLDVRPVSTMLGRLVDRGAVLVEGAGKKRLYSAAEGLYCIYYKLRREHGQASVVRNLILFMLACFTDKDLREIFSNPHMNATRIPALRAGVLQAVAASPRLASLIAVDWPDLVTSKGGADAPDGSAEPFERMAAAFDEEDFERAIELANRLLALRADGDLFGSEPTAARVLVMKGQAHAKLADHPAAFAACTEAIERFSESDVPELREEIAKAYVTRGASEALMGESAAAIATWDEAIGRYGADAAPSLRLAAAKALYNKGVVQQQIGEITAAISTWADVASRLVTDGDAAGGEIVARALFNKGAAESGLGDLRAAVATYDAFVADLGRDKTPQVREIVVMALIALFEWRMRQREWEAASAALENAKRLFLNIDASAIAKRFALGSNAPDGSGEGIGGAEAVLRGCDEILRDIGSGDEPGQRKVLVQVLLCKAVAQGELGDFTGSISSCDDILERFGTDEAMPLREQAAEAMSTKAFAMLQLGRAEDAVAVGDEVDRRFGAECGERFQVQVAAALVAKAMAQSEARQSEEAIATCEEVSQRFGDNDNPEIRFRVVNASLQKAWQQADIGRANAALRTCEELDPRIGELTENTRSAMRRWAMWVRTKALVVQERYAPAREAFRSVWAACDPTDETELREFLMHTVDLVASGAPEEGLVETLDADGSRSAGLAPLLAALRRRAGHPVRAPAEVVAVAEEIDRLIEKRMATRRAPLDS